MVTGVGATDVASHGIVTVTYSPGPGAPVNAGGYTASAHFASTDTNYNDADSTTAASLTIEKAPSTTTVTCPVGVTYNGDAQEPCTASVTGVGGLNQALTPSYSNNKNAGTATANASYDGDSNHKSSSESKTFTINKANATISVTPYNVAYDGLAHTASGTATGVLKENLSGLNLSGTTHTNPGNYALDSWSFTDATGNYNPASGSVTDSIKYGVCTAGPGGVILPPINSDGTSVYQRKGGSTIPVKFRVCAANGSVISNPAAVFAGTGSGQLTLLRAVRGTITAVNETDGLDIPDAAFRFDGSSQWIFNMATNNLSPGTTYVFRINLANGTIQFVVGIK